MNVRQTIAIDVHELSMLLEGVDVSRATSKLGDSPLAASAASIARPSSACHRPVGGRH